MGADVVGERWLSRAELGVLCASMAACAVCALLGDRPAMTDASSHAATGLITQRILEGDAFTMAHYRLSALPLPYWANTILMLPFLWVTDAVTAFEICVAIYVVALPLAYLYLLRVAAPESSHLALLGAITASNWAFYRGEINFLLGQPLVLFGYALFIRLERVRSWRFLAFVAVAVATYSCHVFSLAALMVPVGIHVGLDLIRRRSNAGRHAAAGVALGLVALAAWFVVFQHGSSANSGQIVFDLRPWRLAAFARSPMETVAVPGVNHHVLLLPLLFLLALGPSIGAVFRAARNGRLGETWRAHARLEMLVPGIAFCALGYLGPAGIEEELSFEDIGERFLLCAVLFVFGGLAAARRPAWRLGWLCAGAAMMGLQIYDDVRTQQGYDIRSAAVSRELLTAFPRHSRVLPLRDMDAPSRMDVLLHRHANYVVIERDGYSPHIFARSGQQPLSHVHVKEYRPVGRLEVSDEEWGFYDYVLVQSDQPEPRVPGLREHSIEISRVDRFRAYRILPERRAAK